MAVFTPLDETKIRSLLAAYDVGDYVSHDGILEGVENSNFIVQTTRSKLILTVFEYRTHASDLPFFFGFTDHLMSRGIPCPGPILTTEHETSITLEGKQAALFPFLNGQALKGDQITADHCADVGAFVARMHLAVADFEMVRKNSLSLEGWKALAGKTRDKVNTVQAGLSTLIDTELSWLSENWPQNLPTRAVHTDIFPDNVFFNDNKISAVIDFYFSATDMLAYDLAMVINAWCFDQRFQFRQDCYEALLAGYESVRPLSATEKQALPVLLRGAAMRILMTRLHDHVFHDPQNFVKPHDPLAYLARLTFHQANNIAA